MSLLELMLTIGIIGVIGMEPLAFAVELEHRYVVRRFCPPEGSAQSDGGRRRLRDAETLRLGYLGDCCRVVMMAGQALRRQAC